MLNQGEWDIVKCLIFLFFFFFWLVPVVLLVLQYKTDNETNIFSKSFLRGSSLSAYRNKEDRVYKKNGTFHNVPFPLIQHKLFSILCQNMSKSVPLFN